MEYTPTARQEQLIVRELEDETLVYDRERDEAHCLNQTVAQVWKHCDGTKSVFEIAATIADEAQPPVDEQVVWLALAQLRRKHLLTERIVRSRPNPRISRRELALKVGKAMVLALPVITTIAAPMPASAGSCGNCFQPPTAVCCPVGCPCSMAAACCSGQCSGGQCV